MKTDELIKAVKELRDLNYLLPEIADEVIKAAWQMAADEKRNPTKSPAELTWAAYWGAFKRRHGVAPLDGAVQRRAIGLIVKAIPPEHAPDLVEFYVNHPDAYYDRQKHPLMLCYSQIHKLYTEMQNRQITTAGQGRGNERVAAAQAQIARIRGGQK